MNRADEIRDQIRQMRYLIEEKKFIDDMIRKVDDQRNRLQLEELTLKKIMYNTNQFNRECQEDDYVLEDMSDGNDDNYFLGGTPSGPIKEPMIASFAFKEPSNGHKEPKAVAEAIELDVSQVLLRLACGGHPSAQDIHQMEEQEEEDE